MTDMGTKIQLFLLPFAGGSSLSFMRLIHFLENGIEAIPIEYAGRGKRKDEPFIQDYETFLQDVSTSIQDRRNRKIPYAVLGYSMGCPLAFDISRNEEDPPVYSFFCAEGGLISENPARQYGLLGTEKFEEKILELGGIDERVRSDQQMLRQTMNLVYADHRILAQYRYMGGIINNDAAIIYGREDETIIHMEEWKTVVNGQVDYYLMEGNHFFIKHHFKELAQIINLKLLGGARNIK